MTRADIRLKNLRALIAEAGSAAALARTFEGSAVYISQLLNQKPTKSGTIRSVGDELARRIEKGMNKPRGWMDVSHSAEQRAPRNSESIAEPGIGYRVLSQDDEDLLAGYHQLPDERKTMVWDIIDGHLRRTIPGYAALAGPRDVATSKRADAKLTTRQIIEQSKVLSTSERRLPSKKNR